MSEYFTAHLPNGERICLRVKDDINKLDDLDPLERLPAMQKMFPDPDDDFARHLRRMRKFEEIFRVGKADDGDHDAGDRDDRVPVVDHHASTIANLLVEAGSFPHRAAALHHVLHSATGQALLARMHKKDEPMDRIEQFTNVMKSSGLQNFCKALIDNHSDGISEHELTDAATRYAKSLYPDLSGPQAFAKLYESDVTLRQAVAVAKAWPMPMSLEPLVAPGASGFPSTRLRSGSSPRRGDDAGDVDSVGVSDAYEQLVKMAEQQRRAGESASQAFERIYADPANKHLAEAERSANRPQPTTFFPFPR
jgi:hypothetical protein